MYPCARLLGVIMIVLENPGTTPWAGDPEMYKMQQGRSSSLVSLDVCVFLHYE